MTAFSLQAWLDRVRGAGMKLGLANIRRALTVLGQPQLDLHCVLVGGTNGKGSTVTLASALLHAAGARTGSTLSPHLSEYRERFRIGGEIISQERLDVMAARAHAVLTADPGLDGLTFFELGTALAICSFVDAGCDSAVLEVGMGGEFDASLGCEPAVSVVTNVDLDHMKFLGDSPSAIARTKARIAPPGGILVTGEHREDRLLVLREEAALLGAEIWEPGLQFQGSGTPSRFRYQGPTLRLSGVRLAMRGQHQVENAAVALAAVEALHEQRGTPLPDVQQARSALEAARLAGRMERIPSREGRPALLLDGAHNAAGAAALARSLAASPRPRRRLWIFANMEDKDRGGLFSALLPHVDRVLCTQGLTSPRFTDPESLASEVTAAANHLGIVALRVGSAASPAAALEQALADHGPEDEILVAGSLYLIGDLRPLLGLPLG